MEPRQPCSNWLTNRIKLVVAYDGTDFRGWAAQAGLRTVQGTLTETVRRVSGEDVEIVGASRTDSGAHARGQVCHFDTQVPIKEQKWVMALNRLLPSDLAVKSAGVVPTTFHSRFCAMSRHYRYRIYLGEADPFRERFAFRHWENLKSEAILEAAPKLVGTHDFRAFTEELDPKVENTVRTLKSVQVSLVQDEIRIDIVGTAFLRGMMRRLSGALFEIGRGQRKVDDIEKLLGPQHKTMHLPVVLPAKGLTLMRVIYGRHPKDNRTVSNNDLSASEDAE